MSVKKGLILSAGFLFVMLGVIGSVLPVMPSIPFFIIASVFFSKSSVRFHNMLLNNKLIGPHIKNYHEKKGISLRGKILLIAGQWISILFTCIFFIHNIFSRVFLVIIALAATFYIISLKTLKHDLPARNP